MRFLNSGEGMDKKVHLIMIPSTDTDDLVWSLERKVEEIIKSKHLSL